AAVAHRGEPVVRRDRIVVSTLRCGRSNPGSNPGHGGAFLLSKGDVELLFAASILQLDWWLKLSCVLCRRHPANRTCAPQADVVVAERLRRWT
ncbi:hypothetical protein ABG768_027936, partial [Culter alburnus]